MITASHQLLLLLLAVPWCSVQDAPMSTAAFFQHDFPKCDPLPVLSYSGREVARESSRRTKYAYV
jgi:hypothetical protein